MLLRRHLPLAEHAIDLLPILEMTTEIRGARHLLEVDSPLGQIVPVTFKAILLNYRLNCRARSLSRRVSRKDSRQEADKGVNAFQSRSSDIASHAFNSITTLRVAVSTLRHRRAIPHPRISPNTGNSKKKHAGMARGLVALIWTRMKAGQRGLGESSSMVEPQGSNSKPRDSYSTKTDDAVFAITGTHTHPG